MLNPKTALFFLAFLPQFIDASRGAVWEQALVLGLTFVDVGVCTGSRERVPRAHARIPRHRDA